MFIFRRVLTALLLTICVFSSTDSPKLYKCRVIQTTKTVSYNLESSHATITTGSYHKRKWGISPSFFQWILCSILKKCFFLKIINRKNVLPVSLSIHSSTRSLIFTNTLVYSINTHWLIQLFGEIIYFVDIANSIFSSVKITSLLRGRCLFSVPFLFSHYMYFLSWKILRGNWNQSQNCKINFKYDLEFYNLWLIGKEK